MKPTSRDYEDAQVLLRGHAMDIIFGVTMWTLFNKTRLNMLGPELKDLSIPAARLFFSHILLTLSKIAETYKRYKYLLPDRSKELLRSITKQVEDRNILPFRNKVVGHVWDKDTKRPLSAEETDRRIADIIRDRTEFFTWLLNLNDVTDPQTVVGQLRVCDVELMGKK